MKKVIALCLASLLLIVSMAGCGTQSKPGGQQNAGSSANDKKTIELKVADYFSTNHVISTDGITYWMKKVEQDSGGRVKFNFYPGEQLGKAKDLLKAAQTGAADISMVATSYVPSNMPYSGVMELPGAFTTSEMGEEAYWKMVQGTLKEEFEKNKVKPFIAYVLPPYMIWTSNKPVHVPDDLRGVKLRSAGGATDLITKSIGATPVSMSSTETYEAIQRKVVDGTILAAMSVKPYKLQEVLKYVVGGVSVGSYAGVYVMNQSVWDALPSDIQKIMIQAGEETSKHLAKAMDRVAEDALKEFEKGGLQIYRVTPEEAKQWNEKMASVEQEWIKNIGSTGGSSEVAAKILAERKSLLGNK